MATKALGMVETRGLSGAIEAANTMMHAHDVKFVAKVVIGGGFVTVFIEGDFDAVKNATEAGADSVRKVGELISYHIIPNPHPQLKLILSNNL